MSQTPALAPPAGWYPDSVTPGSMRWWTGTSWTEHVQPAMQAATQPATQAAPYRATTAPTTFRPIQMAVTSLVFGIIALGFNPFFLASVVAWVRGAQGIARAKQSRLDGEGPRGRTLSMWGIAVAGAAIPMGAFQSWLVISAWSLIL